MSIEIAQNIFWVGVTDWGIRRFHGVELSVHRGTTYNAYLIMDEKIAIVDAVWDHHADEFITKIKDIVDPAKIDYVIVNHAEPDHSSSLPILMKHCPNATVVLTKNGAASVEGHYHEKWNFKTVKTGDKLSLGKNELVFIEAPMLHWPDTMFTYVTGHNILMSNDAFGQHYASAFLFNDLVNQAELYEEALKYYANILTLYSDKVLKKIDEILALNLPVDMIAPSHGVIWRKDPLQIVTKYQEWARQIPAPTALIVYDTMWNATEKMAKAIAEGLIECGVDCKVCHAALSDGNDLMVDIFKAKLVVLGSCTHNNGILPSMAKILEEMKGLRFKNKIGAAFGSYGWSGESVKDIEEVFKKAGIPVALPGLRVKWQPGTAEVEACRAMGRQLAAAVKAP
jgi:anaerobic nitric oxide reductase flavorubredoxin